MYGFWQAATGLVAAPAPGSWCDFRSFVFVVSRRKVLGFGFDFDFQHGYE